VSDEEMMLGQADRILAVLNRWLRENPYAPLTLHYSDQTDRFYVFVEPRAGSGIECRGHDARDALAQLTTALANGGDG
jgi:hypothetical protein